MFQTLSVQLNKTHAPRQNSGIALVDYCTSRIGQQSQHVLQSLIKEARRTDAQEGWLLLIAPPFAITKQLLEQAGIAASRVLVLPADSSTKLDRLVRDALTCSTCKAVITFVDDEQSLVDYHYLANKYQTRLVNHARDTATYNTHH